MALAQRRRVAEAADDADAAVVRAAAPVRPEAVHAEFAAEARPHRLGVERVQGERRLLALLLEEQVVRYSLTFLYSLADEACEPAG